MSLKVLVTKMLRNKQAFLSGAGLPVPRLALTEAGPQHPGAGGETPAPGPVRLAASVLRCQQTQRRAKVPDSLGDHAQPAAMWKHQPPRHSNNNNNNYYY